MTKTTYTPFTYLIRLVLARHLVLSESNMPKVVTPMTYGPSISLHQSMLLFRDGSMVSRMSSKYDRLFKLPMRQKVGKKK